MGCGGAPGGLSPDGRAARVAERMADQVARLVRQRRGAPLTPGERQAAASDLTALIASRPAGAGGLQQRDLELVAARIMSGTPALTPAPPPDHGASLDAPLPDCGASGRGSCRSRRSGAPESLRGGSLRGSVRGSVRASHRSGAAAYRPACGASGSGREAAEAAAFAGSRDAYVREAEGAGDGVGLPLRNELPRPPMHPGVAPLESTAAFAPMPAVSRARPNTAVAAGGFLPAGSGARAARAGQAGSGVAAAMAGTATTMSTAAGEAAAGGPSLVVPAHGGMGVVGAAPPATPLGLTQSSAGPGAATLSPARQAVNSRRDAAAHKAIVNAARALPDAVDAPFRRAADAAAVAEQRDHAARLHRRKELQSVTAAELQRQVEARRRAQAHADDGDRQFHDLAAMRARESLALEAAARAERRQVHHRELRAARDAAAAERVERDEALRDGTAADLVAAREAAADAARAEAAVASRRRGQQEALKAALAADVAERVALRSAAQQQAREEDTALLAEIRRRDAAAKEKSEAARRARFAAARQSELEGRRIAAETAAKARQARADDESAILCADAAAVRADREAAEARRRAAVAAHRDLALQIRRHRVDEAVAAQGGPNEADYLRRAAAEEVEAQRDAVAGRRAEKWQWREFLSAQADLQRQERRRGIVHTSLNREPAPLASVVCGEL